MKHFAFNSPPHTQFLFSRTCDRSTGCFFFLSHKSDRPMEDRKKKSRKLSFFSNERREWYSSQTPLKFFEKADNSISLGSVPSRHNIYILFFYVQFGFFSSNSLVRLVVKKENTRILAFVLKNWQLRVYVRRRKYLDVSILIIMHSGEVWF